MAIELSKADRQAAIASLRSYCGKELDQELSELRANLFLDYLLKEIGPFAYNQGVRDAERYFRAKVEDLPSTCFEDPLAYWRSKQPRPLR